MINCLVDEKDILIISLYLHSFSENSDFDYEKNFPCFSMPFYGNKHTTH